MTRCHSVPAWALPLLGVGLALVWTKSLTAEAGAGAGAEPGTPVWQLEAAQREGAATVQAWQAGQARQSGEPAESVWGELIPPLTAPPLLQAPLEALEQDGDAWSRKVSFSMTMAYSSAGITGAGLFPFGLAVALHEIWPCAGRECQGVGSAVGLFGLSGLSLFVFGTGATAYWATRGARELYAGHPPWGAVWMGELAQVFWALSEVALTLAIASPGLAFFWTGALFGLLSIPLALGQMTLTTLRRQKAPPMTPSTSRPSPATATVFTAATSF